MLRISSLLLPFAIAALPVLTPAASAQAIPAYQATIPFKFQVMGHILPAGAYSIVPLSLHTLQLRDNGGRALANLPVFPNLENGRLPSGQLRFHHLGEQYFLSEFSAPDQRSGSHESSRLMPTSKERRAARELQAAKRTPATGTQEVSINVAPPTK